MKSLLILVFLSLGVSGFSQKIVDTIKSDKGSIVVFEDRTWQYQADLEFDGVMNERLNEEVIGDSNLHFTQNWNHDVCYTSELQNDISNLHDTVWLCVQDSSTESFVIPFNGVITSSFGYRKGRNHNGTDIDLHTGDTVRAAWSGKIRYAKFNDGGFGNLVIIRHANGLETFYAHLSEHLVVPNQDVKAGDPIGLGGNTGHSYGSHLHFEVRFYDVPMDPERIINFKEKVVRDENLLVHQGTFKRRASKRGSNYGQNNTTAQQGSASSSSSSSSSSKKYYRIKSGDTLTAIARRNRTTVSKLCHLNGIKQSAILQVGRSLRIR